jgi:hypothetical protein
MIFLACFGQGQGQAGPRNGLEERIMVKRVQRSVLLVALLLACLGAVATAMPQGQAPSGYARLLTRKARLIVPQNSLVEDCLMEKARLREAAGPSGLIPELQFEELRQFCRAAARVEAASIGGDGVPLSDAALATARAHVRERHRQALQELGAASAAER